MNKINLDAGKLKEYWNIIKGLDYENLNENVLSKQNKELIETSLGSVKDYTEMVEDSVKNILNEIDFN